MGSQLSHLKLRTTLFQKPSRMVLWKANAHFLMRFSTMHSPPAYLKSMGNHHHLIVNHASHPFLTTQSLEMVRFFRKDINNNSFPVYRSQGSGKKTEPRWLWQEQGFIMGMRPYTSIGEVGKGLEGRAKRSKKTSPTSQISPLTRRTCQAFQASLRSQECPADRWWP